MKNSQYCWSHSFGRVKGTPLLKNATFHALLGAISIMLTVGIAIHSCARTATMESKIDEILNAVKEYDEENYTELIQRYPLGYVYIAYNLKDGRITTVDRTRPIPDFRINWINARVDQLSKGRISVLIPDFSCRQYFFMSNVVGFVREVGKPQRIGIGTPCVRMWFELLVDDREKFIFVVGFREENSKEK